MDFGLFTTWNAVYAGDKIPWDPDYRGGKLLEKEAYAQNWKEVQAVEDMGWDYIWLGGGHFSTQGSMDPQPLMLSAAIASRTRRIKIGTSIHRPILKQPGDKASPSPSRSPIRPCCCPWIARRASSRWAPTATASPSAAGLRPTTSEGLRCSRKM